MTRLRRTATIAAATGLLALFGGAVHGVATVEATLEPGSEAAAAAERLERKVVRREGRMTTADCPWLREQAAGGSTS